MEIKAVEEAMLRNMMFSARMSGNRLLRFKSTQLASAKDFLTDADGDSEWAIRTHLASQFPNIPLFGEESCEVVDPNRLQWVVDSVDGTVNYYHGDSHWGVSIALVQGGKSIAGVVCLPGKKELFSACRGSLAWKANIDEEGNNGASAFTCVSREKVSDRPLVLLEWVKEQNGGKDHLQVVEIFGRLDQAGFLYPQVRNSSTASLMMVATGQAAGFVHLRPEPFDIAAACLIVEEAGGKVTDFSGNPWSPFAVGKGIVASNGVIHEELLGTISS